MDQTHYVQSILDKYEMSQTNGKSTPIAARLSARDQPSTMDSVKQEEYRAVVGALLYVAMWTRPDIAFAVSDLSRFVSHPGHSHVEASKRVLRYLQSTKSLGLTYSRPSDTATHPPNVLWGYVDSDWAGCPDTRRSTTGFVLMLNGAAVSWRSKRQSLVALSTAEFVTVSVLV